MIKLISTIFLTIFIHPLWADSHAKDIDPAYLDPAYTDLIRVSTERLHEERSTVNDVFAIIDKSTPVKAQVNRGTCSIFSAIAMLETMLVIKKDLPNDIDFSEEYLEYLVVRNRTSDGSNSSRNFLAIANHGIPEEKAYPYIGDDWLEMPWASLPEKRCGYLQGDKKRSCLIIHRDPSLFELNDEELLDPALKTYDPEFVVARNEAQKIRDRYIDIRTRKFSLYSVEQVKQNLQQGIPVTLGIRFFYGAWNHRKSVDYGIGRNMTNWNLGLVGYPEPGSVDRLESPKHDAGHSILVVGYDDSKIVNTEVKMQDGSIQHFRYQGVYYFKNSWGTVGFGKDFVLGGRSLPGYGMISQKHAHEHGGFFHLPLQ